MKKILYIFIIFIGICSCSYIDEPEYVIPGYYYKNITYYTYDTINTYINITSLPYEENNIKIYSDSCYSYKNGVIIVNNYSLYVEVSEDYKITNINWYDAEIWKSVELNHNKNERMYWFLSDVYIDSVYIQMVKEIEHTMIVKTNITKE